MNWFKKFMMGRYGGDQLSMALLITTLILNMLGSLTKVELLVMLSYLPLVWSIYRMLSKNIDRRRMENFKFSTTLSPVYSLLTKYLYRMKDTKTHVYFTCPGCKTNLRVPRGKGNILITCPKCKTEIRRTT